MTIALGWDKRPGGVSGQAGRRPRLSSRGSGVMRREVTAKIPVSAGPGKALEAWASPPASGR